jgi:hypothetical protein
METFGAATHSSVNLILDRMMKNVLFQNILFQKMFRACAFIWQLLPHNTTWPINIKILKHEIPEFLLEYPCVKKRLTYSSPPIQHPWWIDKYRAATQLYVSHIIWDVFVKVGRKCSEYSITYFTSENYSKSKFNVERVVIFNSSTIAAFLWKPPTSLLGQSLCDHGLIQKEKHTTLRVTWQQNKANACSHSSIKVRLAKNPVV